MCKFVILDSDFLYDLLDGDGLAEEVLFTSKIKGFLTAVTPTTGHELMDMALVDRCPAAMNALNMISAQPGGAPIYYPTLDPINRDPETIAVKNGQALFAAQDLIDRGLISSSDFNLALVIAEASLIPARFLVLDRTVLSRLDHGKINKILSERHLATLLFLDKSELYHAISGN